MQLSPSTFPTDPNLLALLVPGAAPVAPAGPAAPGGQVATSFAELLPEADPAEAGLDTGFERPPVMIDAPLGDTQPDLPVLVGEPMPFPRFVAAAPKISPEAPAAPVATAAGEGEEPSVPVEADAKDKAPKASATPKRSVIVANPDKPKKAFAPELIFSSPLAAPVATDLPKMPVPLAEAGEGGDAELPQLPPPPAISAPARFSIRVKVPGAPALVAKFTPVTEPATPVPDAETTPTPVSPEMPRVPQGAVQGKSHSSLPPTSQAPEHSPVWALRMGTAPVQPMTEMEAIDPAVPEPIIEPVLEEPSQTPRQTEDVPQDADWAAPQSRPSPNLPALELRSVWAQAPQLPKGADRGNFPSSLPPTSRALEHSPVWAQRPFIAPQPVVAPVTEPATTNQPLPLSTATVPAEIAPTSPATSANLPPTPLSAETITATVAPALEPVLSPLPEPALPKANLRPRPENFAEPADEFRVNFESADRVVEKIFVSSEAERLTPRSKSVGIGVAKPAANMPSRFSFTPTPHPAFEYAPAVAVASSERAAQVIDAPAPVAAPQEVASSHQAVEAVLRAVDHVATREQHSVNLHFSVGETDLKVRVELRADEVRTTFSTDSAELRSALSHEWQAVAHPEASGSVRIAPATFTSEHATPAFSGDASSRDRQQHQPAHADRNEFAQGRAAFGRSGSPASADARPEVRPAARFLHAGSRHLSTLA